MGAAEVAAAISAGIMGLIWWDIRSFRKDLLSKFHRLQAELWKELETTRKRHDECRDAVTGTTNELKVRIAVMESKNERFTP